MVVDYSKFKKIIGQVVYCYTSQLNITVLAKHFFLKVWLCTCSCGPRLNSVSVYQVQKKIFCRTKTSVWNRLLMGKWLLTHWSTSYSWILFEPQSIKQPAPNSDSILSQKKIKFYWMNCELVLFFSTSKSRPLLISFFLFGWPFGVMWLGNHSFLKSIHCKTSFITKKRY